MKYIKKLITQKSWIKLAILLLGILPLIPFLLATCLITVYAYWPTDLNNFDLFAKDLKENQNLTIIAHGVADTNESWAQPLSNIIHQVKPNSKAIPVNWAYQARNAVSCAINAHRIGKYIATQLSDLQHLQTIHLVGHSCGSHLTYAICKQIKKVNPNIFVKTTYLDPASVYGLNWDYGIENFGRCADRSIAFIDTKDSIPGSNVALPNAITFDVSNLKGNKAINPHVWPTMFYQEYIARFPKLDLSSNAMTNNNKLIEVTEWNILETKQFVTAQ